MIVKINDVDVSSRCIYDIKITAGRADIESQPDASVCNLTLLGIGTEQVGYPISVSIDNTYQLFSGVVTDLTAKQSDNMKWEVSVVSTGPLRALGRFSAGMMGFPEEKDSSRIARILDEIRIPHNINPNAEGPLLLAFEPKRENAGELARKAADSGIGVLWEDPSDSLGRIKYLPAKLRVWNSYQYSWNELPSPWTSYSGNWYSLNSDDSSSSLGK